MLQTIVLWVFYYYAPPQDQGLPLRVTPAGIGLALGLGRLIDALANPLAAHWSDSLRRRGGRRRPFILVGTPVMATAFALLWRPPDAAATMANFLHLTGFLGLFFLTFTLVLNPYMALLPEITASDRDRVTTSGWLAVFSLLGTAAAFVGSAQLASRAGFTTMGLVLALAGALPLLLAGLTIQEPAVHSARVDFVSSVRVVTRNEAFRVFILGFGLLWLGLTMVNLAMALIVTVLMGLPRAAVGTVLGISVAVILLITPAVAAIAHRIGAHRTLVRALGFAAALLPLLATIGRWPVPLSARIQGYVVVALASPAMAALFALPNAILADIARATARDTGQRLEGMFFAFQGLILNCATSVASIAVGGILGLLGYGVGLRIMPVIAAVCVVAGMAVFRRLPIRPSTHAH